MTPAGPDDGPEYPTGLRQRKRLATRHRIIAAARSGALEDGIDALTVEAIARTANVSPRSFFNYFPTKEAAIVGTRDEAQPPITNDDISKLPDDVAEAVTTIVTTVLAGRLDDPWNDDFRALLRRFPQLLDISRSQWKDEVRTATDAVARFLEQRSPVTKDPSVVAPVLVAMCVAAIKSALPSASLDEPEDVAQIALITATLRVAAEAVTAR